MIVSSTLSDSQTITVNPMPDSGMDAMLNVCNVGNGVSVVNIEAARGTADSGTWSETTASGVSITDPTAVDFTGIIPGTYTFEYTTNSAIAPCTNETSTVTVNVTACFDMAMTKDVNTTASGAGPYEANDLITYDLVIYNQGSVDAYDIEVADYIPLGLIFTIGNNPTWTGGTASAPTTTIDFIPANGQQTISIVLQVDPTFSGTSIINNAEIRFATNVDGDPDPAIDEDSTPNDNSMTPPETGSDNEIADDSTGGTDDPSDNDDYDPASIVLGSCPANCDNFPLGMEVINEVFIDFNN